MKLAWRIYVGYHIRRNPNNYWCDHVFPGKGGWSQTPSLFVWYRVWCLYSGTSSLFLFGDQNKRRFICSRLNSDHVSRFLRFTVFTFTWRFASHNNGWNISSKCEKSSSVSGTVAFRHLWTSSDKVFKLMTGDFGTDSPFSLFSAYCFISAVFMICYVPEGKRKTIVEIQEEFNVDWYPRRIKTEWMNLDKC